MDNKKLVETLATKLGRSADDINKLQEGLAGVLRTRCGDLDSVIVPGFGTFEAQRARDGESQNWQAHADTSQNCPWLQGEQCAEV